jgi:RsiW-degrading membrane proteinase PrsW (M82 family)
MKILLLLLAILPGILTIAYIYWRDRYEKEPLFYLSICFLFGVISTYPAIKMEEFGIRDLGIINDKHDAFMTFTFSFIVIAFSEEFVKFIFLRYFIYKKSCFNEPMDGIVYSVMISMGFATLENILYVVIRPEDINIAFQTGLLRMFTAVPAHAIFAIVMGYYVGASKFIATKSNRSLLYGLAGAIALHGLYDFFVFMQMGMALIVFTLVGGLFTSLLFLRNHDRISPYRV